MAYQGLFAFEQVATMIEAGRVLALAGDEALLSRLPEGRWVGGTAANFMTSEGGLADRTRLFVADFTDDVASAEVQHLSCADLSQIGSHYPDNGFAFIILPGFSEIHGVFARNVQDYEGVFVLPLLGWVSAIDVAEIGRAQPKVFAGTGKAFDNEAALLLVTLPEGTEAHVNIVNVFRQGGGEAVEFDAEGFSCHGSCRIEGKAADLADYITERKVDTKLPLVADYNGVMVNVSVRASDAETDMVEFYGPVFRNTVYRFAEPVEDYVARFESVFNEDREDNIAFSCNCILNYLYASLEGKRTSSFVGPITFGEIAYILLNQTLVYLTIEKLD